MPKLHFGSKEYFEKQSEFWFKENSKHISERDAYKKQRDEFRLKAEAYERIEQAYFDNDNYSDEQFMELIEETIEEVSSDLERGSDDNRN